MPQGHVIDIMGVLYNPYSLQYYSFRKTKALVSLTYPYGICFEKSGACPHILRVNGYAPEYVPILKAQ